MEWVTVVVRALACFFSIIVVGLGFIWIAFDREKQGWHDKIAGHGRRPPSQERRPSSDRRRLKS